jgi:hypothetical protein
MSLRLKAKFWVAAYLRQVQLSDAFATVARHGDDDAGHIFIRVMDHDGRSGLLSATTDIDGNRVWRVVQALTKMESNLDELLEREIKRDSDCWIIDVEDRLGHHYLTEKIEGSFVSTDG